MEHTYKTIKNTIDWDIHKTFKLSLWGDVHYDASSCDTVRFAKFMKQTADEGRYSFGMGDYHDFASAREQKAILKSELHETTMEFFDHVVQTKNREFHDQLKPIKPKLLGLIGGNHTWKMANGKYADDDLAERLQTKYLGWLCVYALQFNFYSKMSHTIYFVLCHGAGGGKLPGTSINKIDDLKRIFPFADIYAMGHDHQRGCWPTSTLWPLSINNKLKIKEKRQYLVRTGSFMKSYQEDKSQYTTAGLMRPADLGGVRMNISFERSGSSRQINTIIESIV